jgi:aldehyde:ferredoxin oxidoreductase
MEIMDDHDLLPTHNYKFGSHKDAPKIDSAVWTSFFTQGIPDGCWIGCNMSCAKAIDDYEISSGPYAGQKVIVDGPEYETAAGLGSNGGFFAPLYHRDKLLL